MDGMLKQQQYQQKGSNRFLSSFKFLYLRINGQRFSFPSTIFSCSQSWSFHHFLPPSRMIKRRLAFLPGWTADWCQCQGGGCRVIFGRSGKIRHIDLKSTGNLRGFLIFHMSDALRHWEWPVLLRLLEYTKIGATGWYCCQFRLLFGSSSGRLKPKLLFVSIMVVVVLLLPSLSSSSSIGSSTTSCSFSASVSPSKSLMISMSLMSQSSLVTLVSSPSALSCSTSR